jgi:NAD(P)-dependent dehydrogenase (short-subunit alcohol dehydrogenase family)
MPEPSDLPVAVVTGANSGIGRATAIHLAGHGYRVIGTVRDVGRAGKLLAMSQEARVEVGLLEMDVADDESVRDALSGVGPVDVLVNNAGVGGNATVEECPPALFDEVMNVNLNGAVRCIQAVLPTMRSRRSGTIVNVTSVVGRIGAIAQAPYVASKWALEGMSEELALEVAAFGIRVIVIEPGVTKSAIFAKNVDAPNATGAYDAHYRRLLQFYAAGLASATDPFEVARLIHDAVTTDEPRLRYTCSWGGPELVEGRDRVGGDGWIALGAIADDAAYYDEFSTTFDLDIRPTV